MRGACGSVEGNGELDAVLVMRERVLGRTEGAGS